MAKSIKVYQFKQTSFQYKPTLQSWHFIHPNYQLAIKFKGGVNVARRVAGAFQGAMARKGTLDNMGRGAIDSIIAKHSNSKD